MCNGSRSAKATRDAEAGDNLVIGKSAHNFGVLHLPETTAAACVTCVKTGSKLTLWSIPPDLQQSCEVGQRVVVSFVDGGDYEDSFRLPDKRELKVGIFANEGVKVYVGVMREIGEGELAPDETMPESTAHRRARVLASIVGALLVFAATVASRFV